VSALTQSDLCNVCRTDVLSRYGSIDRYFRSERRVDLFNADLPRIAKIIGGAGLTEHDIDLATSGLCGTFALAIFRHLTNQGIPARLIVVSLRRKAGSPDYVSGHHRNIRHIRWRHAVVESGGAYFDIEGRIELAHAFHNYCWQGAAAASPCQSASVNLRRSFVRPGRPTTVDTT
jgi:hypothetical protein